MSDTKIDTNTGAAVASDTARVRLLRCPKCKSFEINQYRMPTGSIWCEECGYRVEHKDVENPFKINKVDLPGVEGGSWEWKYNDLRKRMENHLLFEIDILTAKIKREERAGSDYELAELHQLRNKVNEILQYMYAVTCDEKLTSNEF